MPPAAPRAIGRRRRYDEMPARIHAWVEGVLGSPVTRAVDQVGGMSPGCATRLLCADGSRAFVKAVGPELISQTPGLFRHEARVLRHLGDDPLWARLLATHDEDRGWVALLLEDVPGRHPDPTDPADVERACDATDDLADRLAGHRRGLEIGTARRSLTRFEEMWPALPDLPGGYLPKWALAVVNEMRGRLPELVSAADGDHVVHYDIRSDNMLVRPDGSLVFFDWGMARAGPAWLDPLVLRLEWADQPLFDELVRRSPALSGLGEDKVTTFLFVLGAWLAYRSTVALDVGLPTINEFRRTESARILVGARRRMGLARAG